MARDAMCRGLEKLKPIDKRSRDIWRVYVSCSEAGETV